MVRNAFEKGLLEEFFNKTLIVLILKVLVLENVSQFKPISLCTASYKMSKVIVNHLKTVMSILVVENQTSFVGERHIMDNVVVAQEVIQSMRIRKGRKWWMALKIDMEKAYTESNRSLFGIHLRMLSYL